MTAALTWLNDLMQWLGRWVPRLVLIHQTHRGVQFGPGGSVRQVGPGLIVYWPITHEVVQVATTLQSIQLCGQMLPLEDDTAAIVPRAAICTINVQFVVRDPVQAATRILHFHALVSNRVQAAVAAAWPGRIPSQNGWLEKAKNSLVGELAGYGIELATIDVAGIGLGATLKNVSDWSYADPVNGKREAA
jgi:hypothetical protein